MGTYAPLRDALHELNTTMRDSRAWEAQHRRDEMEFGLQQLQLENTLKNDEQQRTIRSAQVAEAQAKMEKKPLNALRFLKDSALTRKMLFEYRGGEMSKRLGAALTPGGSVSADGSILTANGQPLALNDFEFDRVAPALYSIATEFDDPEFQINEQIADTQSQISQLDAEIAKMPPSHIHLTTKRAELLAQRSGLNKQLNDYQTQADPSAILSQLRDQYKSVQQFEMAALGHGATGGIQNSIANSKSQISNRIKQFEDNIMAQNLADAKATKEGTNIQRQMAYKVGPNGEIIDSKLVDIKKRDAQALSPEQVNPALAGYEWDSAYAARQKELSDTGGGWKDENNALYRIFWAETTGNIKTGMDARMHTIATGRLAELRSTEEGKKMSPLERLNDAASYPRKVLDDYKDMQAQIVAEVPPMEQEAAIMELRQLWIDQYGFSPEVYETEVVPKFELEEERAQTTLEKERKKQKGR